MNWMEWVNQINIDARIAYLLALTEKIINKIQKYEWYIQVREAVDMCWEWVEEKKHSDDDLYEKMDHENEAGYEDGLLLIEAIYDEVSNDPQVEYVLFCGLEAIAYTVWQAYQ